MRIATLAPALSPGALSRPAPLHFVRAAATARRVQGPSWGPKPNLMKAARIAAIAILVLGAAVLLWLRLRPAPLAVTLAPVERGSVAAIVSNTRAGCIKACRRSKLAPTIGGEIATIYVHKGEQVKRGQPLLALWSQDAVAQLRALEQQIRTSQAHEREACAAAELADRDAARARELRDGQLIAESQYDQVASEARVRRAQCEAARADIQQAEAHARAQRETLTRSVLLAPYAGVIAEINGEVGEVAIPSPPGIPTPPAIDLIDNTCLYVSAPIDEVDAGALTAGMPAAITVDAFPGRRFPGHVRRIAPYVQEAEKQARTVEVEVAFDHPEKLSYLLTGYSADVEITPQERVNVLRVPTRAILQGNRVFVYDSRTGRVEERTITAGLANWEYTEVSGGLRQGDLVVTSLGIEGLQSGARARPAPARP